MHVWWTTSSQPTRIATNSWPQSTRSEREVRKVLSGFLMQTGTLGVDEGRAEWLLASKKPPTTELERRTVLHYLGMKGVFPWEGITWVLDLLPGHPREAISALSAYFLASISFPTGASAG